MKLPHYAALLGLFLAINACGSDDKSKDAPKPQIKLTTTQGVWSAWQKSGQCTLGKQKEVRSCDSPAPESGSFSCLGPAEHIVDCGQPGGWSAWKADGACLN